VRPDVQAQVYLAAERTFLAWIRTGLAMMGFGFVVARFGLFLRELDVAHSSSQPLPHGVSVRFGVVLVVLGVVLTAAAVLRYRRLLERLNRGELLTRPSRLATWLGIALASCGAIVAAYLLLSS
jgi:putative membrane protein